MVARGTVAKLAAAQNKAIFWDTIPTSTAPICCILRFFASPKRDKSVTSTNESGALLQNLALLPQQHDNLLRQPNPIYALLHHTNMHR